MNDCVTHIECEHYRDKIEKDLVENSMKIVELETTLQSLVNITKAILGVAASGVVTMIINMIMK